jgi:hypothetical protein
VIGPESFSIAVYTVSSQVVACEAGMTIRYKCEQCGSILKIKDKLAGTPGKCPKCKSEFTIPEPSGPANAPKAEVSEEDAIFGEGFFDQAEETSTRPKYTVPTDDDDDDDDSDEDFHVNAPASKPVAPIAAHSADNAANMAGNLLGKTGKKNAKQEEYTEDEGPKYDFSAIRYLITHRLLPGIGGGVLLTFLFYKFFAGVMNDERVIPPLASVTGTVMVDDKPVYAELSFNPIVNPQALKETENALKGANSKAWSNATDGTFKAMYTHDIEGAILGKHQVKIVLPKLRRIEVREIMVVEGPNVANFNFEAKATPTPNPNVAPGS